MITDRSNGNQKNSKPETRVNHLLRKARKECMWSQGDLAEHIGVAKETISRWENGISRPQPYQLRKLCEAFEREPEALGYTIEHMTEEPARENPHPSIPINEISHKEDELDLCSEQSIPSDRIVALPRGSAQLSRRYIVAGLALASLAGSTWFAWFRSSTESQPAQHWSSPARHWPTVTYDRYQSLASVRVIQWMLKAHVYDIGPTNVDGVFGPHTQNAIIAFQKCQHLQESGKVDSVTWEQLIIPSYPGSHGSHVTALQERLQAMNFLPSNSIDGDFGPQTEKATRSFRRKMHIVETSEADLNAWCLLVGGTPEKTQSVR